MIGLKHNGVIISIQRWSTHKRPVLCVQMDGENTIYKVASFNSNETTDWFEEVLLKFFDGLTEEKADG